jgi:hypothetical protein
MVLQNNRSAWIVPARQADQMNPSGPSGSAAALAQLVRPRGRDHHRAGAADPMRARGISAISSMLAPGGTLLVIAAIHDPTAPANPTGPWPLTRPEIDAFASQDITARRVEQLANPAQPDQLRWRAEFGRPA